MAGGQTPKPVAQDEWVNVQPPQGDDWQTIGAPEHSPNSFQKMADESVQPEQPLDKGLMGSLEGLYYGAPQAVESVIAHPLKTMSSVVGSFMHPMETAKAVTQDAKQNPGMAISRFVGGLPMMMAAPEAAMDAPDIVRAIPSAKRAGGMLNTIRNEAANVPVTMERTSPEMERFHELTRSGGVGRKPFTQLHNRMQDTENPILFPEARDFYSNIGDATHQTKLQQLMGRGMKPVMRRQGLMAKHALNQDLTSAAEQVGRGEDYTNAMSEYAQAKRLQKILRVGGLLGAGEAARRTGLLGNWIHRTALQQ